MDDSDFFKVDEKKPELKINESLRKIREENEKKIEVIEADNELTEDEDLDMDDTDGFEFEEEEKVYSEKEQKDLKIINELEERENIGNFEIIVNFILF